MLIILPLLFPGAIHTCSLSKPSRNTLILDSPLITASILEKNEKDTKPHKMRHDKHHRKPTCLSPNHLLQEAQCENKSPPKSMTLVVDHNYQGN